MPNGEQNIWHEAWKCRGLVGEFHYMLPTFKCVDWRWDLEVAPWTIQISYQRQWVLRSSHVFNLSWFPWKLLHSVPPEPPKGAVLPAYRGLLYVGDLSMCAPLAHGTIEYSTSSGDFHKHRGKKGGKFWFKSFTSFRVGCMNRVEGPAFLNFQSWSRGQERIWNLPSLGRVHFRFDPTGKTGPSSLISIGDGWQE